MLAPRSVHAGRGPRPRTARAGSIQDLTEYRLGHDRFVLQLVRTEGGALWALLDPGGDVLARSEGELERVEDQARRYKPGDRLIFVPDVVGMDLDGEAAEAISIPAGTPCTVTDVERNHVGAVVAVFINARVPLPGEQWNAPVGMELTLQELREDGLVASYEAH